MSSLDDTMQSCVKQALTELKNIERVLQNVANTTNSEDIKNLIESVQSAVKTLEGPGHKKEYSSTPTLSQGGGAQQNDDDGGS